MVTIGGLIDAWPLFAGVAGLALLLSWVYLFVFKQCAGLLIYVSMIFSAVASLAAGVFFFIAIFMDTDDPNSDYAKFNPIMSVYIGGEAKIYSIVTGIILILLSVIAGVLTNACLKHIDEMVGLIDASLDCVNKNGALVFFANAQAAAFLALVVALVMVGFPYVASLGQLTNSEITVNGIPIEGLQRVWDKTYYEHAALWFYVASCFFLLELFVQFGHFMIAYIVASWYFKIGSKEPIQHLRAIQKAIGNDIGPTKDVRVAGVDANYGVRKGKVVDDPQAGKVLIVPVGKRGPGLGRNNMEDFEFVKKTVNPCDSTELLAESAFYGFFCHMGSFAIGCPIIFFLRPFRMTAACVSGFLTKTADPVKGPSYSEHPHSASLKGCMTLLSACLEQVFGPYNKTAFTEMVLDGKDDFLVCAQNSFAFLLQSGGSIALLHGSLYLYELFGTLCITFVCGWTAWIVQSQVPLFASETSSFYIEDKSASLFVCCIISFAVCTCWMSMWNHTADVLLYCVAWNRRQFHLGEEMQLDHHTELIGKVGDFCPQPIRYLLPPFEMEASYEHGLHAHGISQTGAIMNAMEQMEHGTAHGGSMMSRGPQYSKMVADAHFTAGKFIG